MKGPPGIFSAKLVIVIKRGLDVQWYASKQAAFLAAAVVDRSGRGSVAVRG